MRNFISLSYSLRLVALTLLLSLNAVQAAVIDTSVPLVSADIVNGITMQGTVNYTGSNDQHGIVFGYGDCTYGQPNLMVKVVWAVVRVCFGNSVLYFEPRWQKGTDLVVKIVVPSDILTGGEVLLLLDDVLQTPSGYLRTIEEGNSGAINPNIFGGAFTFDAVTYPNGSNFSVTNVSVYSPDPGGADTTPPVMTIVGNNPTEITVNSIPSYVDSGAIAIDDIDGDISHLIIVSGDAVNVALVGVYTVIYTVQDAAGNTSTASRTVNVIEEEEPEPEPESTISGTIRYSKIIGDDEIAPVTVVNEDDQFKLVVKSTNVPQPLGNLFFLFASNGGSNELSVNGSTTPQEFSIAADANDDLVVNNLLFKVFSASIKTDKFLSQNSPLDNGLLIEVKSENEIFQFLPIKTTTDFNSNFANGTGRSFDLVIGSGGDSLVARFGLANPFIIKKSGTYGNVANDDYIKVIVRDNLLSINEIKFIVSGAKE